MNQQTEPSDAKPALGSRSRRCGKRADQVALEAGNSPSIIFKHYRELTTEEQAEKWFSIMPKEGQWENTLSYDRKKRLVILNGIERD